MIPDSEIKIKRAWKLYDQLKFEINNFLNAKPAEFKKITKNENLHEFYFQINSKPPEILPLLIGEILHNTRSALDSAIYQIVKSRYHGELNDKKSTLIYYKIEIDSEKYYSNKDWHLKTLTDEEVRSIDCYQPFNLAYLKGIDNSKIHLYKAPLARLKIYSNYDKHRQLKLGFLQVQSIAVYGTNKENLLESKLNTKLLRNGEFAYSQKFEIKSVSQPIIEPTFNLCFEEDFRPLYFQPIIDVILGILQHASSTLSLINKIKD